jgi:hypothetical protein
MIPAVGGCPVHVGHATKNTINGTQVLANIRHQRKLVRIDILDRVS